MKSLLTPFVVLLAFMASAQMPGALDPTFGNEGKLLLPLTNNQDRFHAVALDAEERIVAVGYTTSSVTGKDLLCMRFTSGGSVDADFGGGEPFVALDLQLGSDDIAFDVAIQNDGKIVVAGSSDDGTDRNAFLVRLNEDGSLDTEFGDNGVVLTDLDGGLQDEFRCLKIHPLTGNLVAGGSAQISSSLAKPVVARYLSNGTLDTNFDDDGIRLLWITSNDEQYLHSVEDLVVQPNGKISAVGWRDFPGLSWSSDYWAAKINSDGSMDNSFSGDGVNAYNGGFNGHDRAYALLLKPDNTMLVAGGGYLSTLAYDFRAFEINPNGSANSWAAFADYGTFSDDIAQAIIEDASGRYVMAGTAATSSSSTFSIFRSLSNGSGDAQFGNNGKVSTTFGSNAQNVCMDAVLQSDQKIVAVGYSGDDLAIARFLGEPQAQLNEFNLALPANNAENVDFSDTDFDWSNALGAEEYQILVALDPELTNILTDEVVSQSSFSLGGLEPSTTYYWSVRAGNGDGYGDYRQPWSFTTNSLTNFNLLFPTNGETDVNPSGLVLDWTTAVGAMGYQLSYGTDADFSDEVLMTVSSSESAPLLLNADETTYFWRVRATANGDDYGDWSEVWSFVTGTVIGVNESEALDLNVYPNPVMDVLAIVAPVADQNILVRINDSAGKLVYEGVHGAATRLPLGHLAEGLYLLHVIQGDTVHTRRFLKGK